MYGGYCGWARQATRNMYHNGALYSDPRISAYIGMGLHQMPGNVWWSSWRELPPHTGARTIRTSHGRGNRRVPAVNGYWQMYTDPQSGQAVQRLGRSLHLSRHHDCTYIPPGKAGCSKR